ncbi:histidine kinase [Streptosporangium sp. NPDC023615]|uniref:sensor histidine kinase n=1 Tax=Streptosporangium sp. NPDC023615 TaxID=3154794 RepID=UPI0034275D36
MRVRHRPVGRARGAADAGLGVLFAATLAFWAYRIAVTWGGAHWWFGCAAGAVVCAIALVRRRDRARAAVAGLAVAGVTVLVTRLAGLPGEPGPAMALALSVLVGSAVRALPASRAAAVAAGGFAVVAATWPAVPPSSGLPPVTSLNAAAWLAGLALGSCSRLFEARHRAAAERVRREERLALARELHDVVAHHVTGIVLQAQAAQLAARRRPERAEGPFAEIETAGSDALAAVRRVVGLLGDAGDAPSATAVPERLGELVERFGDRGGQGVQEGREHGPAVRLDLSADESAWPPEVAVTVHRIVQESLTNVSRHARQARSVTVRVVQERDSVVVEVVDDAPQAPAGYRRGGYGLVGMRERLDALGGTLRAGPRPGAGWAVLATLPVPARARR